MKQEEKKRNWLTFETVSPSSTHKTDNVFQRQKKIRFKCNQCHRKTAYNVEQNNKNAKKKIVPRKWY